MGNLLRSGAHGDRLFSTIQNSSPETRDTHTLAVYQSGTHIGFTALQDYATVLFPLPGISNDLEVVGVCLPESKLADSIVLRQFR